ncbi:NACHT domain-containing protein [Flavobacterium cerinum]|uniref:NACHT domain-containing protein n=1 Tax=Flavobacterium cerinum TaxID=2502784 RepID=A0ABY5IPZ3_9FLAO|nr:NACHT domain-containing protein [Flavobacterium cerinum]UUC44907.1 NACHT domain-containing protein [Flavobacterium cerinum]
MEKTIELTALISHAIEIVKTINDECENLLGDKLFTYHQAQIEKYYYTNTFIHRDHKEPFFDVYYPIKAICRTKVNTLELHDSNSLNKIFNTHTKIVISGSAGSGKTTLVKSIFLNTCKNRHHIPFFIELRNLNGYSGTFEDYIITKVLHLNIKPNRKILERTLNSGKFLFLLDGYDEIYSNNLELINKGINDFIDKYNKNIFIISTRPGCGIEYNTRFFEFKIQKLSQNDVEEFIRKLILDEERIKQLINAIHLENNMSYKEFLSSPLLLSMFIISFENHPEIPKKKSAFYNNVFDTLYSRHDGITKSSFPREKKTKLEREEFKKVLSTFSFITMGMGKYKFTDEELTTFLIKVKTHMSYNYRIEDMIFDLRTTLCILLYEGLEYSFPHRSMQEYFTALFISELPDQNKNKAYKKLNSLLIESSNDRSFTFWNLCNELDSRAFKKAFMLPELKKIKTKLNKELPDNIKINGFIEIIQPTLVKDIIIITNLNDKNEIEKLETALVRKNNFYNSFLDFCDIYDYSLLTNFIEKSQYKDNFISILLEQKKNNIIPIEKNNIKIKRLLIKSGIIQIIDTISQSIDNKIKEIEKKLGEKEININNLLDF